jgi:hypothetical protein
VTTPERWIVSARVLRYDVEVGDTSYHHGDFARSLAQ